MRPFPLPIAFVLGLVATGAGAQTLSQIPDNGINHAFEGRFGVAYSSDTGSEAISDLRYTMTLAHQTDNGVRFQFALSLELGNSGERWPREDAPGRN